MVSLQFSSAVKKTLYIEVHLPDSRLLKQFPTTYTNRWPQTLFLSHFPIFQNELNKNNELKPFFQTPNTNIQSPLQTLRSAPIQERSAFQFHALLLPFSHRFITGRFSTSSRSRLLMAISSRKPTHLSCT
ncbi:unnamed protein product [Citrullus colocynthis]|uniref:Uncharacterized protein n=1 Tax=Citrullus colocynthis TaxID=252529 RepID=A0ABP0Z9U6_9ROSI